MNIEKVRGWIDNLANNEDCTAEGMRMYAKEALAELDKAAPIRYGRQGPPIQMQDVLLACGELNERELVAVQWVLDKVNELPKHPDKAPEGLHGFTDEEIAIAAEEYACDKRGNINSDRAIGYEDAMRWIRDNGYLAPVAGLTVDVTEIVQIAAVCAADAWSGYVPSGQSVGSPFGKFRNDLRARLTAAIEAKQAAGAGLAVRSITLTGEQPDPAGEIKVLVEFSDGTAVETPPSHSADHASPCTPSSPSQRTISASPLRSLPSPMGA